MKNISTILFRTDLESTHHHITFSCNHDGFLLGCNGDYYHLETERVVINKTVHRDSSRSLTISLLNQQEIFH